MSCSDSPCPAARRAPIPSPGPKPVRHRHAPGRGAAGPGSRGSTRSTSRTPSPRCTTATASTRTTGLSEPPGRRVAAPAPRGESSKVAEPHLLEMSFRCRSEQASGAPRASRCGAMVGAPRAPGRRPLTTNPKPRQSAPPARRRWPASSRVRDAGHARCPCPCRPVPSSGNTKPSGGTLASTSIAAVLLASPDVASTLYRPADVASAVKASVDRLT